MRPALCAVMLLVASALVPLSLSCSDDGEDDDKRLDLGGDLARDLGRDLGPDLGRDLYPPCPMISGPWKITAHCDSSHQGKSVSLTQLGCSFGLTAPFTGWACSLDSANKIKCIGYASRGIPDCVGTLSGKTITLSCGDKTKTCNITLTAG